MLRFILIKVVEEDVVAPSSKKMAFIAKDTGKEAEAEKEVVVEETKREGRRISCKRKSRRNF